MATVKSLVNFFRVHNFNFEETKLFLKNYPHCLPTSENPLNIYRSKCSIRSIKRLLKVDSFVRRIMRHESVWHCFRECRSKGCGSEGIWWNELRHSELLKFIIEAGVDVTKVDSKGRSPLCILLSVGAGVDDINLLLKHGASFNDCIKHDSSFRCVTDYFHDVRLKTDVVKLLLKKGASVQEVDNYVLRRALSHRCCETAAIRILLDHASTSKNLANIKYKYFGNLLHCAVSNRFSKLSVIKLLLEKGVRFDEMDDFGRIPLHEALLDYNQDLRLVKLLLKAGSPVNLKDKYGNTPLSLAVENGIPGNILFALLAAGALINRSTNLGLVPLLEKVINQTKKLGIDRCKILIKFVLIQNPNFPLVRLFEDHFDDGELTIIAEKYRNDLHGMESVIVGHDLTLRKYITQYFRQYVIGDCEPNVNLDVLLQAILNNQFFNFYDVFASKFSKKSLLEKLQQLYVYTTMKRCCEDSCVEHKTGLNKDCLEKLAKYLTKNDLFSLILAFYFTCNYVRND